MDNFWYSISNGLISNWQYFLGFSAIIYGAYSARQIAKKKNSTDLLLHVKTDDKYKDNIRTIHQLETDGKISIRNYAEKENEQSDEARALRYALNHWENVSVGIQNGIYHEGILKETSYTPFIDLFEKTQPYITELQKETKTTYQELCWLANKWKKTKLKIKKDA